MRYIHYDKNGKVMGHYANPQHEFYGDELAYATEPVPDDHPDILAFKQATLDALAESAKERSPDDRLAALEARLAKLEKDK